MGPLLYPKLRTTALGLRFSIRVSVWLALGLGFTFYVSTKPLVVHYCHNAGGG